MSETISKFIEDVIETLSRKNKDREHYSEKKKLDIPFIISSLTQKLNKEEFKSFIDDIITNKYSIEYEDYNDGWLGYGKIIVDLYNEEHEDGNYNYTNLDYQYIFKLTRDQRHWGYCQCCAEDEDYREDKDCCGHGCDWSAPAFILTKEIFVSHEESWNGDEHDYWKFEDNFYKSNKVLTEEKAKRERENKIKSLQDNITIMQKQLENLLNT